MTVSRAVPRAVMMVRTEDAARIKAYPAVCGRCHARDGMSGTRFKQGIPWSLYADHFIRKGWQLGRKPAEDRCPKCLETETAERRAKHHHSSPVTRTDIGKAAKKIAPVVPSAPVVPLEAPQPAYHFGPTYNQLRELQSKFTKPAEPPNEIELLRARVSRLERAVKMLLTERDQRERSVRKTAAL